MVPAFSRAASGTGVVTTLPCEVVRVTDARSAPGSLKSKRHLLRSAVDRVRSRFDVAIAEVGDNDLWQRTVLGVAAVDMARPDLARQDFVEAADVIFLSAVNHADPAPMIGRLLADRPGRLPADSLWEGSTPPPRRAPSGPVKGMDGACPESEARRPQRDVPIGIIVSLVLCTVLYMAVAAVITGMVRYPDIDSHAPIAVAFSQRAVS